MAFEGYLIKIGDKDKFFNKYIKEETYKVSKKVLDMDSYRDATGTLHRSVLDHMSYTVEIGIRALAGADMESLMSAIRNSFKQPKERRVSLTFWLAEESRYVTADCYMPDIDFVINHIDDKNNYIWYDETTLKFIGY